MLTTKTFDKKDVTMIAHRGVSGLETENTVAAFVAAGNRSYFGIETDIHATADGKFVCLHDEDARRVAGVTCRVNREKYEDIKKIKLKDTSGGGGQREDLRIPLLEDYISVCKKYGKHAVLELKDEFDFAQMSEIIGIIREIGHLSDTTFMSFYPKNCYLLRGILPEQSCQFLSDRINKEVIDGVLGARVDLDVVYTALSEENVKLLKAHGVRINCWTVDDEKAAEALVRLGVDYIPSNILE
ncbi:MAG: hypothetical protein J6U35_01345 [Clostridia bacterium]|nr:hypothetical protein [Clostridia bacterium]